MLRSRGLRLLYDAARTGTRGSRINFVHPHDTGGVLVELVEPPPPEPPTAHGSDRRSDATRRQQLADGDREDTIRELT